MRRRKWGSTAIPYKFFKKNLTKTTGDELTTLNPEWEPQSFRELANALIAIYFGHWSTFCLVCIFWIVVILLLLFIFDINLIELYINLFTNI